MRMMSAQSPRARPPPTAWPSIAAITGTGTSRTAFGRRMSAGSSLPSRIASSSSRDAPLENTSGRPSSTATRASAQAASARSASDSSRTNGSDIAFPPGGSDMVTVAMPRSSTSNCTARVLTDCRGGPRYGPPASSSEGGYAPLGLPRPSRGRAPAQPWRASGLTQDVSSGLPGQSSTGHELADRLADLLALQEGPGQLATALQRRSPLGERPVRAETLQRADGIRRRARERAPVGANRLIERVSRRHHVHQPHGLRLGGGVRAPGHDDEARLLEGHALAENRQRDGGNQAEQGFRHAEGRPLRGDHQVAGRDEAHSSGQRLAVHDGHDGLAARADQPHAFHEGGHTARAF